MNQKWTEVIQTGKQIILGKEKELKLALTCILAGGNLLIEDLPGVGKTTMVKFLAKALGLKFSRIQFTNDLLPADIIGTSIFNKKEGTFEFYQGPVFAQLVLADELNRATPKTQSALLEIMSEHKATVDGKEHLMETPFFVVATQNPFTQIGTYPLPESQLDRFLMTLGLGKLSRKDEEELLVSGDRTALIEKLDPILSANEVLAGQQKVQQQVVKKSITNYILDILEATRSDGDANGLSPRAGLALLVCSKAYAFLENRDYVIPEDVKACAPYVMAHRLVSSFEDVHIGEQKAIKLLNEIPVEQLLND